MASWSRGLVEYGAPRRSFLLKSHFRPLKVSTRRCNSPRESRGHLRIEHDGFMSTRAHGGMPAVGTLWREWPHVPRLSCHRLETCITRVRSGGRRTSRGR